MQAIVSSANLFSNSTSNNRVTVVMRSEEKTIIETMKNIVESRMIRGVDDLRPLDLKPLVDAAEQVQLNPDLKKLTSALLAMSQIRMQRCEPCVTLDDVTTFVHVSEMLRQVPEYADVYAEIHDLVCNRHDNLRDPLSPELLAPLVESANRDIDGTDVEPLADTLGQLNSVRERAGLPQLHATDIAPFLLVHFRNYCDGCPENRSTSIENLSSVVQAESILI
jgi:hypothetical protein